MILGQARTSGFTRPAGANPNFQPSIPATGYYSHLQPFPQAGMLPMASYSAYRPPFQAQMGPTALPAVPAPAPITPAPIGPTVPKEGGTAGFGSSGFGSTGGVKAHSHVDPYMVMRAGIIPGVFPSGSNIRAGVRNAGMRVHASLPFQTAPLPPPPPPPAPVPVPAAVHGYYFGAAPRKRSWFARNFLTPQPGEESCETIGPRKDGLYVTICNGRVVNYSDGKGNVQAYPYST